MVAIDARRLLGFSEGYALGNPGLPQCVPEDAHRDNLAPLSPAHECPGTLDPLIPSYRFPTDWTTEWTNRLLSTRVLIRETYQERRRCCSAFAVRRSRSGVARP